MGQSMKSIEERFWRENHSIRTLIFSLKGETHTHKHKHNQTHTDTDIKFLAFAIHSKRQRFVLDDLQNHGLVEK